MRKNKALLDFIKFSESAKVIFYRHAIEQLTGNVFFPTPDVPLAEATASVDALEAAILAAANGDHVAIAAMHAQTELTDNLFRNLVAYVNRIADGDETKILSSGFHESMQPATANKPVLAVNDGANSGSVQLVAKAVEKAGAYFWQYAKDSLPVNENDWISAGNSTQANFYITGLTAASKYYFRVGVLTPAGMNNFCAPVLKIVI